MDDIVDDVGGGSGYRARELTLIASQLQTEGPGGVLEGAEPEEEQAVCARKRDGSR